MGIIDVTGKKFGRLLVLGYVGTNHRNEAVWKCQCDCGKILNVRSEPLRTGHTKSCGCYRKELDEKKVGVPFVYKHKKRYTKIYGVWCNMKRRCNSPTSTYYSHYGGRGIKVCQEWNDDFMSFYSWATENGYKEGLTIDRIDNNGDYEPLNCRWVDRFVQANNKRNNYMIEYNGKKYPIHVLAREYGLANSCLRWRIENGWDIERALHEPSRRKKVV